MIKQETFISVVLVTNNQAGILKQYIEELEPHLNASFSDFEIVVIDQNSKDKTEQNMDTLLKQYKSIRYIKLSQRVNHEVAMGAGIENAIGDFVINLNIDSDPITLIETFITDGKSGVDILLGVSKVNRSLFYKALRFGSEKLLNSIGYSLPKNATGAFCLSRRAVNSVTETGRYYSKLFMKIANTGYIIKALPYSCKPLKVKKKVSEGIRETLHHMVFNSTKPLRWMSGLGVFGSFMAFSFAFYSLVVNLINDHVTEGWTTTILFMSFLFAILFTMLAFFGEYLARLLNDRSEHKDYSVVFEKNSSVMLEINRHNVHFSSVSDENNLTNNRDK